MFYIYRYLQQCVQVNHVCLKTCSSSVWLFLWVFPQIPTANDVLTKIAGAVIALECSSPFAFLLAQCNGVLQSCTHTETQRKMSSLIWSVALAAAVVFSQNIQSRCKTHSQYPHRAIFRPMGQKQTPTSGVTQFLDSIYKKIHNLTEILGFLM